MNQTVDSHKTVRVFVVVPPRTLLLDVAGPIEVLRKANLEQSEVQFEVTFIGPSQTVLSSIGLTIANIEPLPENLPDGALVVISGSADVPLGGVGNSREEDNVLEAQIVSWMRRAIRPGIRLVSICSGALLAARAGLLDGYACTTHHLAIDELNRLAPTSRVLQNRLFVEDRDRLTSAGITSGIDLMLHIVAEIAGHALALSIARYLVVYLRRSGGDPQLSPWLEGRNHMHPVVHRAQDAIAKNPAASWSVEKLADISGASPRNLSRLFNEHAHMSVTDYANRLKVSLAREMLLNSALDMENIAQRAGFASTRQFRRVWERIYDAPPSRMRMLAAAIDSY
ncbi:GlxA family transcriptional regulator [Ochrobactrum quorumnocens]|jgi:transcriptional regulator GlxA family with amidase domain|uniref:Helix-turn-helix domain-containing protein n=1 Tax=Ochrobactrum quorumnocens TaxID=271865 RepID=A0A5N1K501_9HYPH|nr:helix-turn-helix domain-containing protein [[Ochrobactrum] quorumnocens]KAA9370669.1 helix-turn-helix domain-containing protein [[Ochrobactrum] quorumnocens]MBD7990261.1 helix-turn-helix domain-containing protein [Ochrobactrum gallinarum]